MRNNYDNDNDNDSQYPANDNFKEPMGIRGYIAVVLLSALVIFVIQRGLG